MLSLIFFVSYVFFYLLVIFNRSIFVFIQMFRTKFGRIADSVFYILGGNNAFNYSKAIDKLEGYVSPIFAAISSRMQGPNRERYGFIYRVGPRICWLFEKLLSCFFFLSTMERMDLILQSTQELTMRRIKGECSHLKLNSRRREVRFDSNAFLFCLARILRPKLNIGKRIFSVRNVREVVFRYLIDVCRWFDISTVGKSADSKIY